jgi:hypothetical protein
MIRFKVIKGGTILLTAAIVILAAALIVVAISAFKKDDAAPTAAPVFANSAALIPTPYGGENEHTDSIASVPGDIVSRVLPVSNSKSILIYHTHTHEAYEQDVADPYEALEAWRTTDAGHSVVRVGEALASRLRRFGFDVVHDTTDHEGNQLSTAYTRSLATLTEYRERFDLYIDLHRDAYVEGDPVVVKTDSGEEMAPKAECITEEMMAKLRGHGLGVRAWGVFNVQLMKRMCELQVDGMTVNFPDRLFQYIRN